MILKKLKLMLLYPTKNLKKKMHAMKFSRRVLVVVGSSSSSQQTKSLMKQKPTVSHHTRHFLSHLLPCSLASSSSSSVTGGFVPCQKLKSGNLLESRIGFFDSQLPSKGFEPWAFTGFQKRGWKSWVNGANGVVFGLIIANAAVFTMWKVSDQVWMIQNFVLSLYSFTTGRIHTLITSGFSDVAISQFTMNMIGLYYFGPRVARTLGPLYLLKLYFAGAFAGSVLFLGGHALMSIVKSQRFAGKDQPKVLLGAYGAVFAITLLDICLYPKVTTYFELMFRIPAMLGIIALVKDLLKVLEGKNKRITVGSIQAGGGAMVAAIAWRQIRKGRVYY